MPAAHVILFAALVFAAWTDLRRRVIPNGITYPALLGCLSLAFANSGLAGLWDSLQGAIVCGGLLFLAWLCGSLGGGDVKLAALLGAALGWADGMYALMWTFTLAAICMLSLTIWDDGLAGVWRALRSRPLPEANDQTPRQVQPLYLAPAALFAAILIRWPL